MYLSILFHLLQSSPSIIGFQKSAISLELELEELKDLIMDKSTAIPGRRKRSQRSSRPKPQSQPLLDPPAHSTIFSDTPTSKLSTASSKGKVFNLNQCASRPSSGTRGATERAHKKCKDDQGLSSLYSNAGVKVEIEQGDLNEKLHNGGVAPSKQRGLVGDGVATNCFFKKMKLKFGGVTRTIEAKPTSHVTITSESSTKSVSDAPRPQPKLILQDDSDEDTSPPLDIKCGLQGIPLKDFSKGDFNGKEELCTVKMYDKNVSRKLAEKSYIVRKHKSVPKKHDISGEFDDDDDNDEMLYLKKLRTSKVAAGYKDAAEKSGFKQQSLYKVLKVWNNEPAKDFGPSMSDEDGKKAKSERVRDTDYEQEGELMSEGESKGKKKKLGKDITDSPAESKKEMALTTRQRALLSGKDSTSVAGANEIEFPNGLPPPPSRRQKEKLTETEQQLKKAEAGERRRLQKEKAARESEAEAIRKILGQDSSRKKQEDILKKRQEELAQERAVNARTLPPNTVRYVMGPTGTTITFSDDVGLPHIFDPKPCSYPPPREKCAGPSCSNPYRYRDSKTKVPLCSLQCYKAIHEKMQGGDTSC